jgi:hypothetical protein
MLLNWVGSFDTVRLALLEAAPLAGPTALLTTLQRNQALRKAR